MSNVLELNLTYLSEEDRSLALQLANKAEFVKNKTIWKPKLRERYYSISNYNQDLSYFWNESDIDLLRYAIGDCYPTKEDVEFAYEKLKVENELRNYIKENDTKSDWIMGQSRYYLCYDRYCKTIKCFSSDTKIQGGIYFSSNIDCGDMISTIGEDRIKKYIFNVYE